MSYADETIELDIRTKDIHPLLSALKVAEIKAGDDQRWDTAKYLGKLHTYLQKQVFNYGEITD